jgi:hypothetical protein
LSAESGSGVAVFAPEQQLAGWRPGWEGGGRWKGLQRLICSWQSRGWRVGGGVVVRARQRDAMRREGRMLRSTAATQVWGGMRTAHMTEQANTHATRTARTRHDHDSAAPWPRPEFSISKPCKFLSVILFEGAASKEKAKKTGDWAAYLSNLLYSYLWMLFRPKNCLGVWVWVCLFSLFKCFLCLCSIHPSNDLRNQQPTALPAALVSSRPHPRLGGDLAPQNCQFFC